MNPIQLSLNPIKINQKEAEQELKTQEKGLFILRASDQNPNEVILSYTEEEGKVTHLPLKIDRNKIQSATEDFSNIQEVITKYNLKESPSFQKKQEFFNLVSNLKQKAQQDGKSVSMDIEYEQIDETTPEGQAALIEIAKIAAKQAGGETSKLIQNYKINYKTAEGQAALIEIAKIAAQQDGKGTSQYIKNYKIDETTPEGQAALTEIAKIAAQQNGQGTSYYIQNYKINEKTAEGQTALIEIALRASKSNGVGYDISNYKIDEKTAAGQAALIEIAKLNAQKDGESTPSNIKYYKINTETPEGQAALITIAKINARYNGWATSQNIQNFKINGNTAEGQAALVEIAKLSVQQNKGALEYINRYGIKNPDDLIDIHVTALCSLRDKFLQQQSSLEKFNLFPLKQVLRLANGENTTEVIKSVLDEVKTYAEKNSDTAVLKLYQTVNENLNKLESTSKLNEVDIQRIKLNLTAWLALTAAQMIRVKKDSSWSSELQELLLAIMQVQDPTLRNRSTDLLALSLTQTAESYKEMKPNKKDPYCLLASLYLTELGRQKEPNSLGKVANYFNNLKSGSGTLFLKEAAFAKLFLNVIDLLIKDTTLSFEEKQILLNKIVSSGLKDKETLRSAFLAIKGIFDQGKQESLKDISSATDPILFLTETYKQVLQEIYKSIPFNTEMDFEKLDHWINNLREPKAILQYAAKLSSTGDDKKVLLKTLATSLENIVNDKFPACRYENSTHLEEIFKKSPHLKALWMKGEALSLDELNKSSKSEKEGQSELVIIDTDDYSDLLLCGTEAGGNSCQNINGSPAINKCLLAYIIDGKNRLIAIKDKDGRIKARAIMRLLIDETTSKPILFLEQIYPNFLQEEEKKAIENMAKRKAQALNVELFSVHVGKGERQNKPIISLGSPAPYEYVDALESLSTGGGVYRGKFSIMQSHKLI